MRKGEQTAKKNERDYPHIVEMPLPEGGLGTRMEEMESAHRQLGIRQYRGQGRYGAAENRWYARWCFADRQHAEQFARAFGGKVVSP
jgi:hypothetical protein